MDFDEFDEKYNKLLRTGDRTIYDELIHTLSDLSEPACFEFIAFLHDPGCINRVDYKDIKNEIKSTFADQVEANKYKKLAFEAYRKRAEAGNYDYMSRLAELYIEGEGTEKSQEMADYWLDKLYLEKTGMKFKEWLNNNA